MTLVHRDDESYPNISTTGAIIVLIAGTNTDKEKSLRRVFDPIHWMMKVKQGEKLTKTKSPVCYKCHDNLVLVFSAFWGLSLKINFRKQNKNIALQKCH